MASSLSRSVPKPPRAKLVVDVNFEKRLPEAPLLLTPQRKDRRASPLMFLKRTANEPRLTFKKQLEEQRSLGRMRWTFAFPALVIAILVFLVATFLLLYITVFGNVPNLIADPSAIYVSQLPTRALLGLTITTVSTHIVSISAPFLISVVAYCVAGKWLQEQESPNPRRAALPTPLQYGFMVKMLTTSSIAAVIQAGQYMHAAKGIRIPRAFHLAMGLTSLILGLSFSLILADVWLHAASSIVPGGILIDSHLSSFGAVFNESVCANDHGGSCLNDIAGWASTQPWITQNGLLVAANASSDFATITLNDAADLAIVVPRSTTPMDFQAPSFGVRAQCANLTPNCTSAANRPAECSAGTRVALAQGGGSASASVPGTSATSSHSSGTTSAIIPTASSTSSGTQLFATGGVNANPQTVVLQLEWSDPNLALANSAAVKTAAGDVFAWASCDVTFYNVTIEQLRGAYGVVGEPTVADPAFANIMQGALLSQVGNLQLLSNLQATMLPASDEGSAIAAMSQELGRLALALFSGTLQLQSSSSPLVSHSNIANQPSASSPPPPGLGRYPLGPLTVYLIIIYAYSLTAFGVYVYASRLRVPVVRTPGRTPANSAQLAQLRLTDPLAHVAVLYPSPGQAAAPEDLRELFLESQDTPRLEVGIQVPIRGGAQQPVFGVYRRTGSWNALEIV
ncbi:hypothetical protein C8F01DRAFT_1242374 [Mycena amicta]|nr:hypothetical protein C8F01DRAFT_1242374 [Mycena amicta]